MRKVASGSAHALGLRTQLSRPLTLTYYNPIFPYPLVEHDLTLSPLLTHRCWLLLWGILHTCPTQASVLLAHQRPQQVTSPGYPAPYLKGQESRTDIEAPEGFAVRLVFQDFDLEPSPDCEGDSVTVSRARDFGEGGSLPWAVGCYSTLNHPSRERIKCPS